MRGSPASTRAAALASPGVAAIYTADDLLADKVGHLPAISEIKDAAGNRHREPAHLPMPAGKVRHVGDIVAMIVADTLDQARDAAEALEIDYEALPAVVTAAQALAPGAPLVHDDVPGNLMCRWGKGDAAATDAAFAAPRTSRRSPSARRARSCTTWRRARRGRPTTRRTTSSPSPSPRRACRSRIA